MGYFPMFINLKDRKCVVIGGGEVAYRKIEALLEFEADVYVQAKEICQEIYSLDRVHTTVGEYDETCISGALLVIAATDQYQVNERIAKDCERNQIPVNVVDQKELCSFYFPAYVRNGAVTVGISTAGKSPLIASHIRKKIEKSFPDDFADIVEEMGEYREKLKEREPDEQVRKTLLNQFLKEQLEKRSNE